MTVTLTPSGAISVALTSEKPSTPNLAPELTGVTKLSSYWFINRWYCWSVMDMGLQKGPTLPILQTNDRSKLPG